MIHIESYIDGCCKKNPGIGGWGWISYYKFNNDAKLIHLDWGGESKTTNQRMELKAFLKLLKFCDPNKNKILCITTDSEYVLRGVVNLNGKKEYQKIEKTIQGNLGKKTKVKSKTEYFEGYWNHELPNYDLWYKVHQQLIKHFEGGTIIKIKWTKGHMKIKDCKTDDMLRDRKGNDIADKLSNLYPKGIHLLGSKDFPQIDLDI